MDLETLPEAGAPAEQVAPVVAETPEVATPETDQQEQESPEAKAEAERQRAIKNLQRRVDRKHAQAAAAEERARLAEQRAAEIEARYRGEGQDQEALTPDKVLPIAQQMAAQIAEAQQLRDRVTGVLSKGKVLEGFDAACNTVNEEVPFYDGQGRPTHFLREVLDCDSPHAVLHHLGRNPELAAEFAGLSPSKVARRLAVLEAELSKPKEPKQSTAPKPVTPVRATAEPGGLSDSLSPEEWRRRFYKMRRGG